jgi:arylsulfatase
MTPPFTGKIGIDITQDYPGRRPWALTGATIRDVLVDVSGDPYVDLEMGAVAAFMRD